KTTFRLLPRQGATCTPGERGHRRRKTSSGPWTGSVYFLPVKDVDPRNPVEKPPAFTLLLVIGPAQRHTYKRRVKVGGLTPGNDLKTGIINAELDCALHLTAESWRIRIPHARLPVP